MSFEPGKEEVRVQYLPAEDESTKTVCPWCGKEYDVVEEIGSTDYEKVMEVPISHTTAYRHIPCGKLVRFEASDPEPRSVNYTLVPRPSKVPLCSNCREPLMEIWGSDHYRIYFEDGRWHKDEDASHLVCGKCKGELDHAEVEDIMREVGLL